MSGLFGGGTASKEQTQSWANLDKIFGVATQQGTALGAKGQASTDAASKYWTNLLSGNRQQLAGAVAPEATAARTSADAAKRQEAAMGTSRSGGTAAANRELDDKTRAQIDQLINQVRPAAATQVAQIGESQISAMLSALGIGSGAAGTAGSQATQQTMANQAMIAQMFSSLIGAAGTVGGAALMPVKG
jgi:hypothetical protein